MKFAKRSLQPLIVAGFSLLLLIAVIAPKPGWGLTEMGHRTSATDGVELSPDQSLSAASGSTIDYNVYIENKGSSMTNYTLTASSNQSYSVEVWRDTDWLDGGDIHLIPPQGANITLDAGEVATLTIRVTIPPNATDGTADATIIEALSTYLDTSDSITVTTTTDSSLPYPSDWIQLGSDPLGDLPPPARPDKIDVKALYYTNNGTHVFIRMAEADTPDLTPFRYIVYMDTKAGGQQIGSYYYDYFLSSSGVLYEWNGADWVDSGYPTYWQVDGTSIMLWTDLENLGLDTQDIHVLAWSATKSMTTKDEVGPYTILRENISEMSLVLIPLVTLAIYLAISRRRKKRDRALSRKTYSK